jgi:multidrug efflux pump subunit AcrA (membrane-fusion protein)
MVNWFGKCDNYHIQSTTNIRNLQQMKSIALFSVLATLIFSCKNNPETIKISQTDIVESVYASAKIKSFNQYSQRFSVGGKLLNYFVTEGDFVKAGQPIAQLENTTPELSLQNAEMAFQISKDNESLLRDIKLQFQTAQRVCNLDSINYIRQQRLYANNIGTLNQLESFKLKFETSKNSVASLNEKLKSQTSILKHSKSQAQNNIEIARKNAKDFTVNSFIDGKIYALPYKIGEMVVPQQEFAVIGDANKYLLEMEIDEADISKINLGQTVIVKLEAYTQTLKAKISKIYPSLDPKTQSFKIEAIFEGATPTLYPGLTAEANIITNTKNKANVIPLTYLIDNKYVKTKDGNIEVKTGLRNFTHVEILSGIDANTVLIQP